MDHKFIDELIYDFRNVMKLGGWNQPPILAEPLDNENVIKAAHFRHLAHDIIDARPEGDQLTEVKAKLLQKFAEDHHLLKAYKLFNTAITEITKHAQDPGNASYSADRAINNMIFTTSAAIKENSLTESTFTRNITNAVQDAIDFSKTNSQESMR